MDIDIALADVENRILPDVEDEKAQRCIHFLIHAVLQLKQEGNPTSREVQLMIYQVMSQDNKANQEYNAGWQDACKAMLRKLGVK